MNTSASFTSKLTTGDGLNYLNIGLMLISLLAAYILPFEVFLFSYAVLGPLHYLTEISWLDKKNYFIKSKKDIWLMILIVVFITIGLFDSKSKTNLLTGSFLFSGFIYALILLYVENLAVKILMAVAAFTASLVFHFNQYETFPFLFFAIWLPTVIHVYIFTGAFILFGALKSKSSSGILSLGVFIICAFIFFIIKAPGFGIPITDYGKESYPIFKILNTSLYKLFGYGDLGPNETLFFGPNSIAVMRFIAFAYTYHYLNWFSKTTVIKWNEVSKKRMAIIIILWIASVALYLFSYRVGFYALFLLSMLHVFLEFPLNHHTFIGIGTELKALIKK